MLLIQVDVCYICVLGGLLSILSSTLTSNIVAIEIRALSVVAVSELLLILRVTRANPIVNCLVAPPAA